jgi:prepilin-type N-terminal cleavage/methylation domain-containing protein
VKHQGLSLIEVIVSLVLLSVLALGVSSVFSLISSPSRRSTTGSLDLQAANYARQTLEDLKNAVSADETSTGAGADLVDDSHSGCIDADTSDPVAEGSPCTTEGKTYPAGTNSKDPTDPVIVGTPFSRNYTVWDISDGTGGVACKKVTVNVTWS